MSFLLVMTGQAFYVILQIGTLPSSKHNMAKAWNEPYELGSWSTLIDTSYLFFITLLN